MISQVSQPVSLSKPSDKANVQVLAIQLLIKDTNALVSVMVHLNIFISNFCYIFI